MYYTDVEDAITHNLIDKVLGRPGRFIAAANFVKSFVDESFLGGTIIEPRPKIEVKDSRPHRYRRFTLTRRYMGIPRRIDRANSTRGRLMFIHDTAKWIMKYDYTSKITAALDARGLHDQRRCTNIYTHPAR